jgi:predicted RNase H-like HicB family nuclease
MLSYHTCPLATLGGKDTGGMNVYVRDLSRELGRHEDLASKYTYRGFWSEDDGEYVATCIECANLSGLGDSQESALAEARAAVAAWLAHLEAEGRAAPERL